MQVDARKRFERLYFDESTKDKKLNSYVTFLKEHPNTPYRNIAEKNILELSTLNCDPERFLQFIKDYPKSYFVNTAIDYLYHIDPKKIPDSFLSDSLKMMNQVKQWNLLPIYKFDKYGFINHTGTEILKPQYDTVLNDYRCKTITADFLVVGTNGQLLIINKLGHKIWDDNFEEVEDLGQGLLKIKKKDKYGLIHKSGVEVFTPKYENISLINQRFISAYKNGKCGLYSLLGREILSPKYSKIKSVGDFILLYDKDKFDVLTINEISRKANDILYKQHFNYNEFQLLDNGDLLIASNTKKIIINTSLANLIHEEFEEIFLEYGYLVTKNKNTYQLYDKYYSKYPIEPFDNYQTNNSLFFLKKNSKWQLLNLDIPYDTAIILTKNISLATKEDSIHFFLGSNKVVKPIDVIFRIARNNNDPYDPTEFLELSYDDDTKEIYDLSGQLVYKDELEKINVVSSDLIVVQKNGSKGLIDFKGNTIIPPEMDGIGHNKEGLISLLKDAKFGAYRASDSTSIPTIYQKQLSAFGTDYFIARQNDAVGIINRSNEIIVPFEYEEIRYWNDTLALVKENYEWKMYDIINDQSIIEHIKDFSIISEIDNETIIKVLIDNNMGILSSQRGFIVPSTYNDVINIGSVDKPIYMAERNIEEAEFYVIIYYDQKGEIIYKQAYESVDYQKIYCDSN